MRKASESPVCSIQYASQPDLQFACDGVWSDPKWGPESETTTDVKGVYVADNDRLYTFDSESITCKACLAKRTASE